MRKLLVMALSTLLLALPTLANSEAQVLTDLPYVSGGHERQVLDVYMPDTAPVGTLFMVHGGGFIEGDKSEMTHVAERYAGSGYAVINVNYRLAPEVTFPDAHSDVFCALAWTMNHADDYSLNTENLIVLGESAGANIAGYLGTVDDPAPFLDDCPYSLTTLPDIAAVFAFYMPVDLLSCACPMARWLGSFYLDISLQAWNDPAALAEMDDLSMVNSLNDDDPPFYLIHGDRDFLVPLSESEFFASTYAAVGGVVELVVFEGASHGFLTNSRGRILTRAYEQLDRWLAEIISG